jgi:2-polyprenyl-3-methyl-5-hydroxy-6-metoxy-1,4-benzoquinol methylase
VTGTSVKDYYEEYWRRDEPSPLRDPLAATRLRLLEDVIAAEGLQRALDVGCGSGGLVAALRARGLDAVGMDVAGAALERAGAEHPELSLLEHSAEDVPWPVDRASFDLVTSFEVIEHLLRPRRLLEGAAAALRPGGLLAVTTPYHGLLKNVALAVTGFDRHFAVEGDHVRFFSDRALHRLFASAGFSVEQVRHFGRVPGLWAGVFVVGRLR